jgi:hypothetical protein
MSYAYVMQLGQSVAQSSQPKTNALISRKFLRGSFLNSSVNSVDSRSDIHQTFLLTNQISAMQAQIATVMASGGGDRPEDWVGAYRLALNEMNWRLGQKLIIHLADAPAHGNSRPSVSITRKSHLDSRHSLCNVQLRG